MFFTDKSKILFIIYVLVILKSSSEVKRANGGFLTYKEGFISMFVTGAIAVLFCTIFDYFLFNFISPELAEMKREIEIEAMENFGEAVGPKYQPMVDANLEALEESDPAGISNMFKNFVSRLIAPAALSAAFFALLVKRNPPQDSGKNKAEDQKKYIINK